MNLELPSMSPLSMMTHVSLLFTCVPHAVLGVMLHIKTFLYYTDNVKLKHCSCLFCFLYLA